MKITLCEWYQQTFTPSLIIRLNLRSSQQFDQQCLSDLEYPSNVNEATEATLMSEEPNNRARSFERPTSPPLTCHYPNVPSESLIFAQESLDVRHPIPGRRTASRRNKSSSSE